MAIRNLEGYPVQWEVYLILRSLYSMSTNATPNDLFEWFSTDEYRAILPIYFAAIMTQLTQSYIVGITMSEITWWWLGAISVFIFTRNFTSTLIAFGAGLLTCFSPLAVGHIGSGHLHTASSLSLSVFLVFIWRIFTQKVISYYLCSIILSFVLFLSSITYTYQWFLVPFTFVVAAMPSFSKQRMGIWLWGTIGFFMLRWSSYGILAFGQLYVHSHQNDPIRVALYSFESHISSIMSAGIFPGGLLFLIGKILVISQLFVTSYGELVLGAAVFGAVYVRNHHERAVLFTGIALSVLFGAIYGIPWVIMSAYPMVYAMASRGASQLHRIALASLPAGRFQVLQMPRAISATQVILVTAIGLSVNLDLFGDSSFSVRWWQGSFIPH